MNNGKYNLLWSTILIGMTFMLYVGVTRFPFLIMDDQVYVTANEHVRQGLSRQNLFWAFTTVHAEFWHPLTWLSLMLDTTLYGGTPAGYHLTNLLLHIASVIFLFLTFNAMTNHYFRSFVLAALFALHPLHVETVAWIAERKEVLCGFFWITSLYAYARYARNPGVRWYIVVAILFFLGLMSKSMIITLPFTLLLLDIWPLKRWCNRWKLFLHLVVEKIPLFLLSIMGIGLTVYAQRAGGGIVGLDAYSFSSRLTNILISYKMYIVKTFFPSKLSIFYPFPTHIPFVQSLSALVLLIFISVIGIILFLNQKQYFLIGWCWFLGTLVPVIGIIKIGDFAMADRYMYMPIVGLLFASIWLVADLMRVQQRAGKIMFGITCTTAIILSGISAHNYLLCWKDNKTLFRHAAKTAAPNFFAHYTLGHLYADQGQLVEAERHLRIAVAIRPDKQTIRLDLGRLLGSIGDFTEATRHFQYVIQGNRENLAAHYYMGLALLGEGRRSEALNHFLFAIQDIVNIQRDVKNFLKAGDLEGGLIVLGINEETTAVKKKMALGYNYWRSRILP